jgi:hypothetical protein
LFTLLASATLLAAEPQSIRRPLVFEPNRGQAPAQVKWVARGPGYQLFLTTEGVTVMVKERPDPLPKRNVFSVTFPPAAQKRQISKPMYSAVSLKLIGSRPWNDVTGLEPTGGVSNYLLGNDPKAWHTNVPHYARIRANGVYDGIDLVFYSQGGNLEYDFIVAPGADPNQIRLAFEGQGRMRVDDKSGDLVLTTPGGSELLQIRPRVYQQVGDERVEVAGGYELLDHGRAAFALASYDPRQPLVIDPTVIFQHTFLGNDHDEASAVAVDANGNAYVTGLTNSYNFLNSCYSNCGAPATPPLQPDQPGMDAFVLAVNPQGNLLFVTYLGGEGYDAAYGIAVNASGIYITGTTTSIHFPQQNSKKTTDQDVFVTKMTLSGNRINYTAIVGGSGVDVGNSIAVDLASQQAYVTGTTYSGNFPNSYHITGAGPDPYDGGAGDVFVFYLDSFGNLAKSIRIPAKSIDWGSSIALAHDGSAWIAGMTCSSDFTALAPTPGAYRGSCSGFVVKWRPLLSSPQFARFLIGGQAVAVDPSGNGYVVGYDPIGYLGEIMELTKLDPTGAILKNVAVTGGAWFVEYARGNGIAVNAQGEVYITGYAQDNLMHHSGLYLVKLKSTLNASDLFEYLVEPGATGENGTGIAIFDGSPFNPPQIYIASTSNFAPTSGAPSSSRDALVYRLDDDWAGLGLKRLQNSSNQTQYINIESGAVAVSTIQPTWLSAEWNIIEQTPIAGDPAGQKVYWIQNQLKPDEFLNVESGSIQSTPIQPGWLNARWTFELVDGTTTFQIHNVGRPDEYLNIVNGVLAAGPRVTIPPPPPTKAGGAGIGRPTWYWILNPVN